MNWPNPPRPISAAIVTSPIVETVAMRMPAMMTGIASGISTRQSICLGVNPIPSAASLASLGTLSSPARMLRIRMSSV